MKEKLNISLIITIATILISVGGSWGVIQNKVKDVDKLKEKSEVVETKVAVIETKLDNIDENMKEQRQLMKEHKEDLKEILRAIKQ